MPLTQRPASIRTQDAGGTPRGRSWLRRCRRVFLLLLLLATVLACGFVYLTHPQRLAKLAAMELSALTGAEVTIGAAHFQIGGPLVLHDVVMDVPAAGAGSRILEVARVRIEHHHPAIWRGRFQPTRIDLLDDARIHLTEDREQERFNVEWLLERLPHDEFPIKKELPQVHFEHLQLIPGELTSRGYTARDTIRLRGALTASGGPGDPIYTLDIRSPGNPGSSGDRGKRAGPGAPETATDTILTGQIDLDAATLGLSLHHIGLDSPLTGTLPARWRQWLADRQPSGRIERISFHTGPDQPARAAIELAGTRILPPGCREPLFLTVERGGVTIEGNEVNTDIGGKLGGFDYRLTGKVTQAFSAHPIIDLRLRSHGRIEPDPPWLDWIADETVREGIERELEGFNPEGPLELDVNLTQGRDDDRLRYDAEVYLSGVRAKFKDFPYPVHDVRGRLRLRDGELHIDPLRAVGPSGAVFTVEASVDNVGRVPGPYAGQVRVQSHAVPIDEHLLQALEPEEREAVEMFFDHEAHRRLEDAGHVQARQRLQSLKARYEATRQHLDVLDDAPDEAEHREALAAHLEQLEQRIEDADEAAAFELGGTVAVEAVIRRDEQVRRLWHPEIIIRPSGLQFIYEDWPYPATVEAGTVRIQRRDVEVNNISLQLLGGAAANVDGTVQPRPHDPDGPSIPDLAIALTGVPVDDLLLATLPPDDSAWLGSLNLEGLIDARGRIGGVEADAPAYRINADLHHARAWPNRDRGGAYPLEALEANLHIEPDLIEVKRLKARHGPTRFSGNARIAGRDRHRDVQLELAAEGLRFEDPVLDMTPVGREEADTVTELLDRYAVRGAGNASVQLRAIGEGDPQFTVELQPQWLDLEIDRQHIALRNGRGRAVFDARKVMLEDIGFNREGGSFHINGEVALREDPDLDVHFSARGESFDSATRAVLPADVRTVIDDIELASGYDLRSARLRRVVDDAGEATIGFSGNLALDDATMRIGFPITAMDTAVQIDLNHAPGDAMPRLEMGIDAARLRYHDRLIEPLRARLVSANGGEDLHIRDLHGSVYDGSITGHGRISRANDTTRYALELALQEAALQPLTDPESEEKWLTAKRRRARQLSEAEDTIIEADDTTDRRIGEGVVSANLTLAGTIGDADSRRGRGLVRVRDARLFEFPLALAVAQIINLNLPASSAFNSVHGDYLVEGDTVKFEDARFLAPALEMRGSGTLDLSDSGLAMVFHSRNPDGRDQIGPFPDLFRMLKTELFSIRIYGTIEQPEARLQTLQATSRTIQELFGPRPKTENE